VDHRQLYSLRTVLQPERTPTELFTSVHQKPAAWPWPTAVLPAVHRCVPVRYGQFMNTSRATPTPGRLILPYPPWTINPWVAWYFCTSVH